MIKANEVRLGNWIIDDGEICKVDLIAGYDNWENTEPINLTEEWHKKFGVKLNGFYNFEYVIDKNRRIIFNTDYVFIRQNNPNKRIIDDDIVTLWNNDIKKRDIYVHEWQNLYFALTGKELIINNGTKTNTEITC